jgi:signal transduction histidine kinase
MNSLFLRVYLSALTFLLIAFFAILFIANNVIFKGLLVDSSTHLYQTISKSLATKDKSTWQSEIKTYNALATDYTLSLVTPDSLTEAEQQALASLNNKNSGTISNNLLGREDLYALYPLPHSKWVLKIDEDNDSGNTLSNLADSIIIFLLLMLPLAFALFLLVRKLTKPIQHLAFVAKQLGDGDLNARADINLIPPMNTLASGFNTMAGQLDDTLKEQQILVGAIPHELRSPLGRIRFALDMTRNNTTANEYRKDIEKIDTYVDQMQTTVDEILELNRLQNQPITDPVNVSLCLIIDLLSKQLQKDAPSLKVITTVIKITLF